MSVKEQLLASFKDLPDDASWGQAEERLRLLAAIDEAEQQVARGEGIPHEEVVRQFRSWFQK
jgi:hypothetical protein